MDDDDFFETSSNVEVWKRSVLPLRVQNSNAATSIVGPSVNANLLSENTGEVPLNKRAMGVHTAGEPIQLSYETRTGAGTEAFGNSDAELLVARLNPEATSGMGFDNMKMTELSDLVSEDSNSDAHFEIADTISLDENGENSEISYTPSESGNYVFFLVQSDTSNDFTTSEGDLNIDGPVRVIGMDATVVQQAPSQVSVDDKGQPGDSFTFEADTDLKGEVTHTVVLYREGKLKSQQFNVVVDGEIDQSISSDQVTVEHSLERVNGVANIPNSVADSDEFDDGRFSGSAELQDVVGLLAEQIGVNKPKTESTDTNTLDASVTTVTSEDGTTEITVETLESWSLGSYRYVHYAAGENTDEISTNTGKVTIEEADTDPGPSDPNPSDPDPEDPGPPNNNGGGGNAGPVNSVEKRVENGKLRIDITQVDAGQTVRTGFDEPIGANGVGLQQFDFTTNKSIKNVNVEVEPLAERPSDIPDPGGPVAALFDVRLNGFDDSSISGGTFRFTLSEDAREKLGASPDEVTMYRYHNGQWQTLETTHVSGEKYKAETPGFSYFAVGKAQAGQPNYNFGDISLDSQAVAPGETVTVETTVSNDGTAAGSDVAELTANGQVIQQQNFQVDAGGSTTVTFKITFSETGSYDLAINGNDAGTLQVSEDGDTSPDDSEQPNDGEQEPAETPGSDGDGGLGSLAVSILLVLALLAVGLSVFYFRDDLQEKF